MEEEIEEFYKRLEKVLNDLPKKDIKILVGWNAKVGNDNSGWEKAMGRYGYGDRNDRSINGVCNKKEPFCNQHKIPAIKKAGSGLRWHHMENIRT